VYALKPGRSPVTLSEEVAAKVEERIMHTLKGIEETLREILERGEVDSEEVRSILEALKPSFSLLSQRWVLEILYSLLLRGPLGFNELKRLLGASSRSLSLKLKALVELGYLERDVERGPPLRTTYRLTRTGKDAALLSLPLLYYMAKHSALNPRKGDYEET